MRGKYRIKEGGTNCRNLPAGTVCYGFVGHDYGLASDDTRMTGIPHVSVTLDPDGGIPSFTIRESSLERIAE